MQFPDLPSGKDPQLTLKDFVMRALYDRRRLRQRQRHHRHRVHRTSRRRVHHRLLAGPDDDPAAAPLMPRLCRFT